MAETDTMDLTSEERWPTMHRLARDLEAAGAPAEMTEKALDGRYDDFHPNAGVTAIIDLVNDLNAAGLTEMAEAAKDGKYDATPEESKAWAESEEGRDAMAALVERKNPLKNEEGQQLPLTDPERMLAAADLVRRAGGRDFQVGYDDKDPKNVTWWAQTTIVDNPQMGEAAGRTARVGDHPKPEDAAEALAKFLMDGGTCQRCHRTIVVGGDRSLRLTNCRWTRKAATWTPGCAKP